MEEIIRSIRQYELSRDIRGLLKRIGAGHPTDKDLSIVLLELFRQDLISRTELLVLRSKFLMNRYVRWMKEIVPQMDCGIYLYENHACRIWNGSVAAVPSAFNEYTHGLPVWSDIVDDTNQPEYLHKILLVPDVERAEDPITLNHRTQLLHSDVRMYCTLPLEFEQKTVGHQLFVSSSINSLSVDRLHYLAKYPRYLVSELVHAKEALIHSIQS